MTARQRILALAVGSCIVVACGSSESAVDPTAIYAAALQPVLASVPDSVSVVLERETRWPGPEHAEPYFRAIGAAPSLVRAHHSLNEKSILLDLAVAGVLGLDLWADSLSNPSAMWGAWTSAYKRHAYVIVVSRPAVSQDGEKALMHYFLGCGALCGEGYVVRLEHEGTHWRVVADTTYVVS